MPSQSSWEGESTPDHRTSTESRDLLRVFGDSEMVADWIGERKREMREKRRTIMVVDGKGSRDTRR